MNENEITLVTAFFDIGRENIPNKELQRTNKQYFSFFEHWARMKNNLIVYTESKNVETVLQIRKNFGLESRTTIVSIDNIFEVEEDLYTKMCLIENREDFKKFRYYEKAYSNTAKYVYIMFMKYWVLQDAFARKIILTNKVAWIDFGFGHGEERYPNAEEFSFLWDYNFSKKISLFCLNNPDKLLGADSLQLLNDCIMGCLIYIPTDMIESFWMLLLECVKALLSLDCIDDDQQLLLMAYKRQPELFEIHISDWFMPLKEYGGEHLTISSKVKETNWNTHIKQLLKCFAERLFGNGGGAKRFAKRSYERAKKFYSD